MHDVCMYICICKKKSFLALKAFDFHTIILRVRHYRVKKSDDKLQQHSFPYSLIIDVVYVKDCLCAELQKAEEVKSELSQDESGSESEELQHTDVEDGEECDEDMVRHVCIDIYIRNEIVRSED